MIRYALQCAEGHRFESWFRNAAAYDALAAAGHVACPECGGTRVSKSLMTPDVRPARAAAPESRETPESSRPAPLAPSGPEEAALSAFKARLEAEADYVGARFAREARAIHEGDAPARPIYGEASREEAVALIEDGVPVAPLPFLPTRKTN
ncbi:MAG: DUF1178 family protein [Alphaproteobacteria bacterium]|nr:MAG: DUF1178 family protein [Alphaproteobacteria bacterium]